MTRNRDCPDNTSDPAVPDPNRPDGFAVDDGSDCDDVLERRESLTVTIAAAGSDAIAAFDVNGVWLTDFDPARKGDAGEIEITGLDASDSHAYSFIWKDLDADKISEVNPNDELFVGFGETLRITSAVLTTTAGGYSLAGFSQQPIVIINDDCEQDGGQSGCRAEIAKDVSLEILNTASGSPGDRGVNGVLLKLGFYFGPDAREQCQPGFDPADLAYKLWGDLPIDLDGDGTYELVMKPHQCGYPDLAHPGEPVVYVLDLDGSELTIVEDTITMLFNDDGDDPESRDEYFCNASAAYKRPGYGWIPHSRLNEFGAYEEIPVFDADGNPIIDVQDVTTGPCGSGRGGWTRYSYVAYNWRNAFGTPYVVTIGERVGQLQVYVEQLFPCVQQGVNQSTLSDDTGHIRKSFDMGRYQRAVDYIAEMRAHVLAPRLNDEISQCFFDLDSGGYVKEDDPGGNRAAANAVGNLLVQLDHLRWMIRSTILGESPAEIPAP